MMAEKKRKMFHLSFGLIVLTLSYLWRELAVAFVIVSFIAGTIILNMKLKGMKVPIADELLETLGRKGEPHGHGAFWYVLGLLMALTFIRGTGGMLAAVLMLGVADGVSAIVGATGKTRLPYNRRKTLEGSIAFALTSLASFFWIGWLAVPFSLLGAFVESVDSRYDDNLLIPLFACFFFFLFS